MVQMRSGGGIFAVFQLHSVYSDNFPSWDLFFIVHPAAILWSAEVSQNENRIPDFNGNLGAAVVAVLHFSGLETFI